MCKGACISGKRYQRFVKWIFFIFSPILHVFCLFEIHMKAIYIYTAEYEFYTQKFINHKKTNIHITQGFICAFKNFYVYIIAFLKKKITENIKEKIT